MKHVIVSLLMAAAPMMAAAQHNLHPGATETLRNEAKILLDEHHYYGASTTTDTSGKKTLPDAEVLMADYWLKEPGTEVRMAEWLLRHPVHPLTSRIALMRASLLVREARYREALSLYNATPIDNLPQEELSEARLYEAIASIHTGQVERAEQVLESIVSSETHGMDVQYYLGYVHYIQGHYREALPCLTAASASYDYRRSAPVLLADCQVQEGHYADALQTLRQWRRATGATLLAAEADRIEGEAYYGVRHYDEAIAPLKHYVQAVAEPSRTALYKLGMSQLQTEKYEEAALHLSRSTGTVRDAMSQSAWLHAGIAYIQTAQKQRARMAFQQASEMNFDPKTQEEALYNYALTLRDGGDMGFGETQSVYEQFLRQFPTSKHAETISHHLISVYVKNQNYEAALAALNRIRNLDADGRKTKQQVLSQLASKAYNTHNYAATIDYMNQSIAVGPSAQAHYWKGEAEYQQGRYDTAIADLRRALSLSADDTDYVVEANYTLGYALFKQKKYSEALPCFQKVAKMSKQSAYRSDAYCRAADCQFVARNYDAAYANYQKAIDTYGLNLESDHTPQDYPRIQQAMIEGLRGNYSRKIELLSRVNETGPNAAMALFEKGKSYVASGQKAKAIETFGALLQKFPQTPQARRSVNETALLYAESGRTDEAIRLYRSVIADYPNTAEAQTALSNLKDLYTAQGRINEYAQLASQAGKALLPRELDDMTADAALRATSSGHPEQALAYYKQLEAQTLSADTRTKALVGQLHAAQAMKNPTVTAETASRVLVSSPLNADLAAEAHLCRGLAYIAQGDTRQGVADLQEASKNQRSVYGAQATVELAQYAYNTQQYQSAEQVLSQFIDSGTTHSYWLARAFVLLSDVCAKTGRDVEARQYLLSLKSNYTESEEINQMIQQRLSQLK